MKKYYLSIKKVEQAKYTYSLLGKAFERHTKATEDEGNKHVEAIRNQGQVRKKH